MARIVSANIFAALFFFYFYSSLNNVSALEMKNSAYEDFTITFSDGVPSTNCKDLLNNLEDTLTSASQYLFSALDGRSFLKTATVVLPPSWPDSCAPTPIVSGSGDVSDVTVLTTGGTQGKLWTQQSAGCGQPGDQIYMGYERLEKRDDTLARSLVKEFAMYRYGVFEEQGYENDPVYPMCYHDDATKTVKVTGCSDLPINSNGICDGSNKDYNTTKMVDDKARSSLMFAAEAPSVSMFCDEGNHDRYAPTKHNLICQRKSTFEVIIGHPDFLANNLASNIKGDIVDTTPLITYKKQILTRYVLVIENTKEMVQRESWSFLKHAIRKWSNFDLPDNTEVGMVLTNDTGSMKMFNLRSLRNARHRDYVSSELPFMPGDSTQSPCLVCALKEAIEMLNGRVREQGPANNVIVLIAPGINLNKEIDHVISDAKKSKIRIATVNYPDVTRTTSLDLLSRGTGGKSYTVFEKKINVDTSSLSTYFQLSNILYNIMETYYSGNPADLPIEIHRKEIKNIGRSSITGSFVLDDKLGEPARFMLYTHSSENLMIKRLKLTSPSHEVYERKSELMLITRVISLVTNISEPGTWTYTVEPYAGNPQPHFLQVMASPLSRTVPVVRAKFWTHRNQPGAPLILLTEVKYGDYPVLGAKVEVQITKHEPNGTIFYSERLELLDTGSGDPDITRGDGVYTRYFSPATGGIGMYSFEVTVTDNGNTAYSSSDFSNAMDDKPCCGSMVPTQSVQPLQPFQRVLPPIVMDIPTIEVAPVPSGRIGNLRVETMPDELKARLSWTSPDMGGHTVDRYEIRYTDNVEDISDRFEINAIKFEEASPFPLPPGSETTFTLHLTGQKHKDLLDKPIYIAVKAYPQFLSENFATISNWVRVYIPSPPPPPTAPPTYASHDNLWPFPVHNEGEETVGPRVVKTITIGLEIILPVVIGIIILIVLLIVYCYFCVLKRRSNDAHKKSGKEAAMNDKLNSTITIIPSSPTNSSQTLQHGYSNNIEVPDHHTVGVPINTYDSYDDDPKKPSYSLVHQQEQQLIEELKQQQHMQRDQMNTPNNNYGGLSVISSNSLQRNGHTLSPYNSWSASQLLHEHERRHSPMDNMIQDEGMMNQQDMMQNEHMMINSQPEHMMINGSQADHMSLSGQNMDHISMNGHQIANQMPEHYTQGHIPPPVPPLPVITSNGYPVNYNIYGVHQPQNQVSQPHQIYQSMQRNDPLVPFNPSLQGSMSSVNSGEKKRRNVTMV